MLWEILSLLTSSSFQLQELRWITYTTDSKVKESLSVYFSPSLSLLKWYILIYSFIYLNIHLCLLSLFKQHSSKGSCCWHKSNAIDLYCSITFEATSAVDFISFKCELLFLWHREQWVLDWAWHPYVPVNECVCRCLQMCKWSSVKHILPWTFLRIRWLPKLCKPPIICTTSLSMIQRQIFFLGNRALITCPEKKLMTHQW